MAVAHVSFCLDHTALRRTEYLILIVTNRRDLTADFLILELQRRGAEFIRFNTEDYPREVGVTWRMENHRRTGRLVFSKKNEVRLDDVRSVWYRRPVPPHPDETITDPVYREFAMAESQAALDGLWRAMDCFWVSNPDSLRRAENKLLQLKLADEVGLEVWPTLVTTCAEEAQAFYEACDKNTVYKPLRRGYLTRNGERSLIYTNPLPSGEEPDFTAVKLAPVLLQKQIPKKLEVRVTVVGNDVFAAGIDSQRVPEARHDWRRASADQLPHEPHALPVSVVRACRRLVKSLGLAFGAIDFVLTPSGQYVFLEINPNGQWAWVQQLCPSIRIREALCELLVTGGGAYVQ